MRAYKFIVQAVLLDEKKGRVTGEHAMSPRVLYGERLSEVSAAFDAELDEFLASDQPASPNET